ncbi:protein transport protein S31 [Coemansia sp. RSA 1722]|nr:protein transport protein S31 [Coemansia sp. RSA 486]KAJ2234020.1 protein transport protein S31 [Coemansia sp. RSA 485]KAJ2599758.1 protein transport protein S31 [Coemansia sp. RSA 1721]KAJ2601442.1 protein transport protein S31 [Coemansia sp. RSA 1722]KAJ2637320.1 protein transport protein S31 [Coemansia sp. RSA 1286]
MVFQYIERTAIPAWGPQQSESLIAAGTVAGAMDATFSNTSELEIFRLGASDSSAGALESIGKVEAAARFQRLAWSGRSGSHELGVLAGGLENGDVAVWDPARIIAGEDDVVLHASSAHTGAVGGLEFNPFQANLMASGAANGEVFVWDIVSEFKSYSPGARSQRIDSVTDLAWNNQVQHILATASNTGALVVWDLKSRREVIALNSPGAIGSAATGRGGISACAWNPASATQLVTASSDDSNPSIMLWDLRNANAPSQVFTGHHRGVLSLSWCRKDAGLLLSSGKDNRTVCWNPMTGEIVGELPPSSNWVYDVQWNQSNPNLLSGASFDGRVNLYTLARESESVESSVAVSDDPFAPQSSTAFAPSLSLKRPPKWLARPCGAVFGFGGQLVRFTQTAGSMVSIDELVSEPELAEQASQLRELLLNDQAAELCNKRLEQSKGSDEERSWQVLQLLFDPNARDKLIRFLGFDKAEVKQRIAELIGARRAAEAESSVKSAESPLESAAEPAAERLSDAGADTSADAAEENPFAGSVSADAEAEDFFSKPIETPVAPGDSTAATVGSAAPTEIIESAADADIRALRVAFSGAFRIYDKAKDIASEDADGLITRAVLLGDIEAAVELCIEKELFADALILATCGSADLASRAQQAYFAKRAQQASYVRLLHSIVTGDLTDVVSNGDLGEWDEILALLCTYAQGDQFSNLCELLGRRLERANELNNAVMCYLASGNLDKVAAIWVSRESGSVGHERVQRLHLLMEKVAVFRKAVQFVDPAVDAEYTGPFPLAPLYDSYIEYARFLASQGLFDMANKYLESTPASYKYYLPTGEDGLATLRNLLSGGNAQAPWTLDLVGADHSKNAQQAAQPVQTQQQPQQQPQMYQQYSPYAPTGGMGYPQASMPAVQHYSATGSSMYPAASAAYSGMTQGYPAMAPPQQQQQQPTVFPPPPQPLNPASIPTGSTPPPRREETAWNDPPMVTKPTKRAPASAIKPAAIVSPFPQGRNTPPLPPSGGPAAAFGTARSPVGGASAVPPPPRTGFMPPGSTAAPAPPPSSVAKPLPPAPQMAFPNAQHAPQMMQPQQPFQPMQTQQPGMASGPMQAMQPMRGQVVSAASGSAAAISRSNTPAASSATTATAPAKTSKYPEGDRSHIPGEWAPIFNGLNGHVQRAKQFAAPAQKRMVDDAQRRLNLLFDLMNCDEIKMKDKLCPVFEQLLQSINNRQFPQALHYQAELMTINSDITTHLVGVKHLINVLKTLPM